MATILETLAIRLVLDGAEFAKGMGTVETSWTQMGQRMTNAGRNMSMFVTAPLLGIGVAALKTAADFETNMNQFHVVSKATAADMKQLTDQALDLGKKTSFSAGEAAAAMLELGKAGLNVAQVSGAIPGVLDLAAAGGLELANAAEIAANAVNVFGMDASAATTIANMFAAAANASSVEVTDIADSFKMAGSVWAMAKQDADNLTTAIALMGNAGMKGSDAGTSLKQMMLSLTAPTKAASETLGEWGIRVFDNSGNMLDMRDIIAQLEDRFGAMGTKLVTLNGATEDMAKEFEKAGPKIEPLTIKLSEQEAELGILQNELAATIAKYGEGTTQVERKQLAVTKLTNDITQNREALAVLQTTVDVYNQALANGKDAEIAVSDAMRAKAMATIFGSDAVRAANVLVAEGVEGYDAMMASVTEAGAAQEMATAKTKGLSGAIEYFKGTIDTLMIETASPWLDQLSQMIRGAADLIAKFGDLPAPIQRAVVIFGALLAAVGPVLVMVGTLITSVTAIAGALAGLGPIVAGAGAVLAALTGPIGLVLAAVTGLAVAWHQNWFGIQDAVAAGVKFIKEAFNLDWGSIGRNLVESITNGIKSGWDAITGAATHVAQGALSAAKSALGIASPSSEGLAIGDNYAGSIAQGIVRRWNAQADSWRNIVLDKLGRPIMDALKGQLNVFEDGSMRLLGDSLSPDAMARLINGLYSTDDRLAALTPNVKAALRGLYTIFEDGSLRRNDNATNNNVSISMSNTFAGSADSAAVATASRDGVLAALRQAGYA